MDQRIKHEQLTLLFAGLPSSLIATVVLLALAIGLAEPSDTVLACAALPLVSLLRLALWLAYRHYSQRENLAWSNLFFCRLRGGRGVGPSDLTPGMSFVLHVVHADDVERARAEFIAELTGKEHLFQQFSQADSSDSRRLAGTGLSLAISRAIAERLGSHIGFDTGPNGTTFYFELPDADSIAAASLPLSQSNAS